MTGSRRRMGVGAHAKHLRNLYVYFWRWAAWKVFEQGAGGRDLRPPVQEQLSGLVCYITVSGFLKWPRVSEDAGGPTQDCDEIWIIDCSPEGHQPDVPTRIFQGVQQPVCIVLASRSPANDPELAARVRFKSLQNGTGLKPSSLSWPPFGLRVTVGKIARPNGGRPFYLRHSAHWSSFVAIEALFNYNSFRIDDWTHLGDCTGRADTGEAMENPLRRA